jgi:predicted transcriptional regulator/RimJ/RimL family protein N-acetyltransferase
MDGSRISRVAETTPSRSLLLSIKHEHAQRIFNGSKHYELRKVLPKERFKRVFLYESGGSGVVGCFDAGRIIKKSVSDLWEEVGPEATTQDRFFAYFANFTNGYAIEIRNPLRFNTPVSAKRLNGDFTKLVPPQNFLVLDPGQPLYTILESERTVTLQNSPPRVTLRRIAKEQHETYRKLVYRHISPHYEDIDESFADSNLRVHEKGFDSAGFFTIRKEVLSVYNDRGRCIGFTTLTYKSGGCVKSGPTILFRPFRRRGFGAATRRAIERRVREHSCRKIYCTCPDNAESTIRYLLASGMRIEAHLERHYASDHDELVFGKLLIADEDGEISTRSLKSRQAKVALPSAFKKKQLVTDFMQMFRDTWSPVSREIAQAIIEQSLGRAETTPDKKPKRMVCLESGVNCLGAVALLPKRGGAMKGVLFRSTSHEASIRHLLQAALDQAVSLNGRKLYFLHPVLDSEAILLIRQLGFRAEGLLRAPYRPGQDVIVMSRFL